MRLTRFADPCFWRRNSTTILYEHSKWVFIISSQFYRTYCQCDINMTENYFGPVKVLRLTCAFDHILLWSNEHLVCYWRFLEQHLKTCIRLHLVCYWRFLEQHIKTSIRLQTLCVNNAWCHKIRNWTRTRYCTRYQSSLNFYIFIHSSILYICISTYMIYHQSHETSNIMTLTMSFQEDVFKRKRQEHYVESDPLKLISCLS